MAHVSIPMTPNNPDSGAGPLSRTSTALRRAAPAPGADTDVILTEYGYTPDDIAALKASGAAGVDPDTNKQVKGRSK